MAWEVEGTRKFEEWYASLEVVPKADRLYATYIEELRSEGSL